MRKRCSPGRWQGPNGPAAVAVALCLVAACGKPPSWEIYRFDDHLADDAKISAPALVSSREAAPELEWDFSEPVVTWLSVRGKMGFRPDGHLVVKGEGESPLILSPDEPLIDWTKYESLLIRMAVAGGRRIRLRFPEQVYEKRLAPPLEYRVYRFDLNFHGPSYKARLAIEPTDSPNQAAAIDYIRLIPRRTRFTEPAAVLTVEKRAEHRRSVYVRTPSSISYEIPLPEDARLRFGLGVADPQGITFRVTVDGAAVFSRTVSDASAWVDEEVDLSEYGGDTVRLAFETEGPEGAVAFWATPVLTSAEAKARPNIVLYMIDTLRADHTSVYGYSRDTTPFLKKLGAEGVVFDDCQAQSTWTKPSVATLLTSLHTPAHGIDEFTDTIPAGATTLAAALREAGYVTASIIGNPFSGRNSGLERGVDHLFEYPAIQRWRRRAERATDSAALNRVAFQWLERHRGEPFFLYLHSTDPHAPYRPPKTTEAQFADPAESAEFQQDYEKLKQVIGPYGGGAVFNRRQARAKGVDPDLWVRRAIDRYDAEVLFNDRSIELLVEKLRDLGVLENTLIVVVSDHGEEFLEHGWTTHGHSLYEEVTRVVFLMWNPKLIPAPRRIREPVGLVDVMPTILDLIGAPADGVMQGRSLAPLIRGEAEPEDRPVMAARLPERTPPPPGGGIPENRTTTIAWIDSAWKLIYRPDGESRGLLRVELYDRRADRAEKHNVADRNPQIVGRLLPKLQQWWEGQQEVRALLGPSERRKLDPATLERLRSLGYVGGGTAAPLEGSPPGGGSEAK